MMTMNGKNGIMIYGPKEDGTYVVEFRTAWGATLAISIPRTERCWFAPHDMRIGAKIIDAIDEAIRLRDKVLLICPRVLSRATGSRVR
jgi:hypothetical protein